MLPTAGPALDALPTAGARIDRDGMIVEANRRWCELFGLGEDRPEGQPLSRWCPAEPMLRAGLGEAAAGNGSLRLQALRGDGVPVTLILDVAPEADGRRLVCLGREVSGTDLLSESQRYLDVAFEVAPVGMALFDTHGRYVRVNDALCRLLGRGREELLGRRDQEFTHPEDRQSDVDAAWRILRGELDCWQTEKRFVSASGETVWVIANLTFLRDGDGRPLSWLGQFQDITARRTREEALGHIAVHDELTTLANRRGLIEKLTDALAHARRYDEPGAVLLLDLDGFKQVNDRDGHQAGDALLVRAAAALRNRLRVTDFVARLGGDEFAVILPHADTTAARLVGAQLLDALAHLEAAELSASIGIALYDHETPDVSSLLANADRAMYEAKARGPGQVLVAHSG